jgi:hypothetical protein
VGATLTPEVWNRLLLKADLEVYADFSKAIQVYNLTRNPPMETSLTICELYCILLKWMLKITSFNLQVCLTPGERIIKKNYLKFFSGNAGTVHRNICLRSPSVCIVVVNLVFQTSSLIVLQCREIGLKAASHKGRLINCSILKNIT